MALSNDLQRLEPAHPGKPQIEQHHVWLAFGQPGECVLTRRRQRYGVPLTLEFASECTSVRVVVVNEQERGGLHAGWRATLAPAAGTTTSNTEPAPGSLSTVMFPPHRRAKSSDRNRPRPVPP